jgi:hypothetical protein
MYGIVPHLPPLKHPPKYPAFAAVILSERGPRRTLQPGGGESKDLRLFFNELMTHYTCGEGGVFPFVTRITTPPLANPHTLSS